MLTEADATHDAPGGLKAALERMRLGEPVVLEGERDAGPHYLVLHADAATPAAVAFMVRHTSGLLAASLPASRIRALRLPALGHNDRRARDHEAAGGQMVTTDARTGTTTGISAADRAVTVAALVDPSTRPADLSRPGHVLILRADDAGVLGRCEPAEVALDLAREAGGSSGAVLAELVDDRAEVCNLAQARAFATHHGIERVDASQVLTRRLVSGSLVTHVNTAHIKTAHGLFTARSYRFEPDGSEHVVMSRGLANPQALVHVRADCTSAALGSTTCVCASNLDRALERVSRVRAGIVVTIRGREIGLASHVAPHPHSARIAAQIIAAEGVSTAWLLGGDSAQERALRDCGVEVISTGAPADAEPSEATSGENEGYEVPAESLPEFFRSSAPAPTLLAGMTEAYEA